VPGAGRQDVPSGWLPGQPGTALTKVWHSVLAEDSAEESLRNALQAARDAGSFQIIVSLDRIITQQRALSFAPREDPSALTSAVMWSAPTGRLLRWRRPSPWPSRRAIFVSS